MQYDIYGGGATVLKAWVIYKESNWISANMLNKVPADGLVISGHSFALDESSMTGESKIVSKDPRWGRCYESFSEDTEVVRKLSCLVMGLQGQPPEGHPSGYPYLGGSWNGKKVHTNYHFLTEILKNKFGFKAMSTQDKQVSNPPGSNYRECVMFGINAGIDMVMVPFKFEILWNDFPSLAESGEIPMARTDDAVERILRVKFITRVFDHTFTDRSLLDVVGCKAHRELAREAVRKSLRSLLHNHFGCTKRSDGRQNRIIFEPTPSEETFSGQDFSYAIGETPYAETAGDDPELKIPLNGC
nr:beta-glucosidase BoGH3B-like isoform X2 [Ipomoea batatas]